MTNFNLILEQFLILNLNSNLLSSPLKKTFMTVSHINFNLSLVTAFAIFFFFF